MDGKAGHPPLGHRGLSIGAGARRLSLADDLVSPLRYSGVSWNVSLVAGFSVPAAISGIRLSYANPKLTSSITRKGSHLQRGHWIELRTPFFHRAAGFRNGDLSFLLGGALTAQLSLYEHWYLKRERESFTHLFGLVEPGGAWHLRLSGGSEVWQEVTIPLAGLVVRPPYQGLTEVPGPSWEGPGGVKGIHQSLHYRRSFGGDWRGGITYSFQGLRYPKPRPLALIRHTLGISLILWGASP